MNRSRRIWRLIIAVLVALIATNVWAWLHLSEAKDGAQLAANDMQVCREVASHIISLRQRPTIAQSEAIASSELVRRLEQSLAAARVPADRLTSVSPESPRRVGDSPYLEKPTQLQIRLVTLPQFVNFLHAVVSDSSLRVTNLRLATPHEEKAGDTWNADVTVSYWIYSPRAEKDSAGGAL